MSPEPRSTTATAASSSRREAILASALETFVRHGYRKTSMEDVARSADVSRPGLYFLFSSKEDLFRTAVVRTLRHDLATIEEVLADDGRPLGERLIEAFDQWAGRYVGPGTRDLWAVVDENPELLGSIVTTSPRRFEQLVVAAIATETTPERAKQVAQTLISTSVGLKHLAGTRREYRRRLGVAVELLLLAPR